MIPRVIPKKPCFWQKYSWYQRRVWKRAFRLLAQLHERMSSSHETTHVVKTIHKVMEKRHAYQG